MKDKFQLPPEIVAIDKRRKRKKWMLIGFVLTALLVLGVGLYFLISTIIESSDAYKVAKAAVVGNEKVISITGGSQEVSMSNGSISINNGFGNASFTMEVNGKDKDAEVYIELEQKPLSKWKVISLTVAEEE